MPSEGLDIQLLYDINQITEQNSQNGSFHPILLHSMIEHLASDTKNINESLKQITNYIKNKSIKNNKMNNIMDLKEIGEVIQNFIASIYDSDWNSLIADKDNHTLRQKVVTKFTPKLHEIKKESTNKKPVDKLANFVRISPLILAKTLKEVNKISKYFKKNSQLKKVSKNKKYYAQTLKSPSNIKEIFKQVKLKAFRK